MSKKKKILIVDSDLPACRAYQKLFAKAGIEANCALDGDEALKVADSSYDCVLIDTSDLGKSDGWEVVARIKNHDHIRHLPVIIFTSLDGDHYRKKAKEVKADGFVAKFSPDQVVEEVKKILAGGAERGNLH